MFEYDEVKLVLFSKLWGLITSHVVFNKYAAYVGIQNQSRQTAREKKRIPPVKVRQGNCSRGTSEAKMGSTLVGALTQAHPQLRLKQQQLTSGDENGTSERKNKC